MKYFSLEYTLLKQDYESFEKSRMKAELLSKIKVLAVIFVLMGVLSFLVDPSFIIAFFAMVVSIIVLPFLINRMSSTETRKHSNIISKPMALHFYDNHFEMEYLPFENHKSHTVRHFGFDTVASVLESQEHFYFIFKTNNLLIIPKRELDDEKFIMIRNLISNLFKNRYAVI